MDEALPKDEDKGSNVWPTDLIRIIGEITSMPIVKMAEHDFVFDLSMAAAEKNADLLLLDSMVVSWRTQSTQTDTPF